MIYEEKPALLIIDMVKDYFDPKHDLPIARNARKIIGPLNNLIREFRNNKWPVVFSTDAFEKDDFLFKGKMKPHSIAGTKGAEVIDELDKRDEDLWLPKPRFSAFFKTGLEDWLREKGITLCAVGGIATHFCVLTTVMDAVCNNFKAVLIEDCSTAYPEQYHKHVVEMYKKNPLYPLLRVMSSIDLLNSLKCKKG